MNKHTIEFYEQGKFGINGSDINISLIADHILPDQLRDEVPTLNKFGYMKLDLDEFAEDFIEYAAASDDLVLELGCAYGEVVKKVLERNGKIIASDISREHLEIVLKRVDEAKLNNLFLYQGAFPGEINLPEESLAAVLSCRMFHFLTGEQIEEGFKKIHKWLKPGGKLFLTVVTPLNYTLRDTFLKTYRERVAKGDRWPGIVDNMREHAKEHAPYIKDFIHVFDVPQLERLLAEFGFKIEKIKLFDHPNGKDSDDKGHVGLVAVKI